MLFRKKSGNEQLKICLEIAKEAVAMTMKNRYCDSLFLQHHGIRIGISDLGQYSIKQKMNLNFYYSILKAKRETEK